MVGALVDIATDSQQALRDVMQRYWGHSGFLPLQAEAMDSVLSGRDSIVVLPTGGGKSLCFQAPAMCLDGMAVVVSPLISLMKDQVDALLSCGIPAAYLNSSLGPQERRLVMEQIRDQSLRLLYVAPERLLIDAAFGFLQGARISFFAIDEAHCISSWGHDFRPEYRGLRLLKERFPETAVHAYTATATELVREDVLRQLELKEPSVLVGSFDRPNLCYRVRRSSNKIRQIRRVLDARRGDSGIIYCIKRAEVEKTSERLNALGYRTLPYHAGLSDGERQRNQDAFITEEVETIVATIAFGMGIDKSNVRYVIHSGMPKSLEHYQQESGRAGRDGLEADCLLLFSSGDYGTWKRIIELNESEGREGALRSLAGIYDYCCGVGCRHQALSHHFGQSLDHESCQACDVCLGDLKLVEDPVTVGQKIISCVLRVDQRFGGDYVSQVLCGSRDQRILQNRHDQLSTWGILSDQPRRAVRDWIEQLVDQDCLRKTGDYNVLYVTPLGVDLIKGTYTPRLLRPVDPKKKTAKRSASYEDSWEGVDRELFQHLRQLRSAKAKARNLPAYIIFSDAALRDMARRRPTTPSEFLLVKGVGEKKCRDFGDEFLECIREFGECRDAEAPLKCD